MSRTPKKTHSKASAAPKNKKKSVKKGLGGRLVLGLLNLGIWGAALGGLVVLWFAYDLPSISRLEQSTRRPGVTLLARDGSLLATYGDLYGQFVALKDLPSYVPQAVIAIEDHRFYDHFGLDVVGLSRAMMTNYRAGRVVQGGSTLTQQLAKDFLLQEGIYTYQDKSLRRKVQELLLALWFETHFSKEQILSLYLNRAYLGAGVFGVDAAALKYFGKHAKDLTLYEAGVIAGLLKAPSKFAPTVSPDLCDKRATLVLEQMAQFRFITAQQKDLALFMKTPLGLTKKEANFGRYFADWVFDMLPDLVGGLTQDLVVTTTLDPLLQRRADEESQKIFNTYGKEAHFSQLSLVSMTPSGAVRALVGGVNYTQSQFNRAVQAKRQAGSLFKLFVHLSALESGMTPQSMVSDLPIRIGSWKPRNYNNLWVAKGEITLQDSLAHSVNTSAVRLAQQMGVSRLHEIAQRLGLASPQPKDLTVALGSGEASLLELTSAYGTLANRGYGVWPHGVTKIKETATGKILYERTHKTNNRVMSPQAAHDGLTLLKAVMAYGTGRKSALNRPCAGKSGTSQNNKDAWFIGMTPDIVTGVWMGNDNAAPTKDVTGGKYPGYLWKAYMEAIHQGVRARNFGS